MPTYCLCQANHHFIPKLKPESHYRQSVLRNTQHLAMIKSFEHKGLALFFRTENMQGINPALSERLKLQLAALDTVRRIKDLNIRNYRLHQLKGNRQSVWSIKVTANWPLTFEFTDGHVHILDYEDYH
jgi:proteic killer suppression protein